jgi:hypothetical protein
VRAELLAMEPDDILRDVRVSARVTVGMVEAAVGRVLPLRGELIALCGERAAPVLDRLPIYARATTQAGVEEKALALSNNLSELHEALRADYGLVITELDSLVMRKVLESSVIAPARGIQGYEETIQSMRVAIFVARKHWSTIEGKTQLTAAILDGAALKADTLERAIIERDGGIAQAPAVELRVRALSKLLKEYDELRRMVTYLRWHERDYDTLAPSPFTGRKARASGEEEEDVEDEDVDPTDDDSPLAPSPDIGGPFIS